MFERQAREKIAAALDAAVPGSSAIGAVTYVERLLTAFDHDPPRIWAAPPTPGDGPVWLELGPWEAHAWRQRIADYRAVYERVASDTADGDDLRVVHLHACEATYGDPAYGGNRNQAGWVRIDFPAPLFPPARDEETTP